jgi:hypothetical protein
MNATVTTRSTAGLARWAALGGILYVILFVVGTILLFAGAPDSDASPAKVMSYYADSGHRDRIGIGWVVAGLGVFFFLWFLATLRQTVRRFEGDDGFLTALTTIGGIVYAALAFAALAVNMGIRTMSDDTYRHTVYPELIHAADDAGYVLHATGGAGAATMIAAVTFAAFATRRIRGWVAALGFLAALLALFSILFFTQLAIAIWILVVSGVLFVRGAGVDGGTPATR